MSPPHSRTAPALFLPIPTRFEGKHWLLILAGFTALALLVMMWRWGGTIEDSQAYFDTARFLRGDIAAQELRAPFPYRILVPAIAAAMPGDVRQSFAILNWLLISAAAGTMALTLARLGFSRARVIGAGLLLLLSVPTYWYAPYLLVDPGSICARAVFVLAVVTGQPWLAAAAGIAGTAVREENILLLVWLLAMRRIPLMAGLAALALAGAWILAVRWWMIPGLPSYVWAPRVGQLFYALRDHASLLSIAAAASVVLPLALAGMRRHLPQLQPLKSLLLLMALPPLYALLCVRIDGRVIWSLYPMLIPFALSVGLRKAA